jgi:hypothetical protein
VTGQPIAPVTFSALSKKPGPYEEPDLEYFNVSLDSTELGPLTTPYEKPGQNAGFIVACAGLAPLAVGLLLVLYKFLLVVAHMMPLHAVLELPDFVTVPVLAGLGVCLLGSLWAVHMGAPYRGRFKTWQQSVIDTWQAAEGRVIPINQIPVAGKDKAISMIRRLEEVRGQLEQCDPRGDELDAARAAVHRYIQASDIPLLLKQAAAAPHIRDRAVRQAAKDYTVAVARQEVARHDAEQAVDACFALLDSRRQARTDAELIRRANAR